MKKFFMLSHKRKVSKKGGSRAASPCEGETSGTSVGHREDVERGLDIVIETIQKVKDLVPITAAKNILTGISTILVLLRASLKNKDSLRGLLRNCEDICSILAQATKGVDQDRMNEALKKALGSLESSVSDLQSRVEGALEHGRARRFVGATLDEKDISDWTAELNKILTSLSAKLNIVMVIRLEQIYELLQHSDLPNLIPDPPPPPPAMFFGRDGLLLRLKEALLQNKDIVLIGPGGIGKSTIAMAVMNDDDVIQSYRRRFFVTYDGIDPTKVTFDSFMDRIASVLGLPTSGADGERQVKSNLSLSRVLLVLDNAEVFEDASNRDEAKRISDFISHIANTAGVAVLLTSRTSGNARRVRWTQVDLPPLEKGPARSYFRDIYDGEISDDDIDGLLTEVDFHPLSISILSYTARECRWTGNVLLERWSAQKSRFLRTGDGKDNLAFTIRLSFDSPSVKILGDDALRVLRIVAFLPQGINSNQDYISRLFPTVCDISSVVDTLCKVSLISPSGAFLTTLAPVRLFLLDSFPITSPELDAIRRTYYESLEEITKEKNPHVNLLVSDHFNIESLIAFDIAHSAGDISTIAVVCSQFLYRLAYNQPRSSLLVPLIFSLPEESSTEKVSKARCLAAVGRLYMELSNFSVGGAANSIATTLFEAVGKYNDAAYCIQHAAQSYHFQGYSSRAHRLLNDFTCSASWQRVDEERKAAIYYSLDLCTVNMSPEYVDTLFLRSVDHQIYGVHSRICHLTARMHHGRSTPQEIERALEPLRPTCMSSDAFKRWYFFEATAETAFRQRRFSVATQLLNQAHDVVNGNFRLTLKILRHKVAIASAQGDYDLARSLLQSRLDALGVVATPSSIEFLKLLFVQALNELYAGSYPKARQLFIDIVAHCDGCDEIQVKTWCKRALGELELALGRKTDSDTYFAQAVELCREAGVPPELLGIWEPMMQPDDEKFPGWKRFLQAHTTQS